MSTIKPEMNMGEPLQLFQPIQFVVFLTFFSPIILAVSITSLSFMFQNFKGLIYLGFLLAVCIVRNYIYMLSGSPPIVNDRTICNSVQYSKYGNPTFSTFVFAFTIMYLSMPMFSNDASNPWVFISLVAYACVDIFMKLYKNCIPKMSDLFLNVLMGLASGAAIVSFMYIGGSGKFLFFNEVSSNKDICYKPKEQTFKCNLFRNGEMVGSI
jgi:hypothetical protein